MAERLRLVVRGAVQGVGFRPFVYRLAHERQLRGWVHNSSHGVVIEVEGERAQLDDFRVALERERPPRAACSRRPASSRTTAACPCRGIWLSGLGCLPG